MTMQPETVIYIMFSASGRNGNSTIVKFQAETIIILGFAPYVSTVSENCSLNMMIVSCGYEAFTIKVNDSNLQLCISDTFAHPQNNSVCQQNLTGMTSYYIKDVSLYNFITIMSTASPQNVTIQYSQPATVLTPDLTAVIKIYNYTLCFTNEYIDFQS